jgi:acetate---CoA ligase (ADP-forming)
MGGASVRNLLAYGFPGAIYPINNGVAQVQGIPAYPSLGDCPTKPDTIVIAVPAAAVPDLLLQAADIGIRSATVISAGFGEGAAGDSGQGLDRELREIVEAYGFALLGPNTTGLANVNARYVPRAVLNSPDDLQPSGLAIVAQSGALSNVLLCRAYDGGFGAGFCVATGDEMALRVDHWLSYLAADDEIQGVICVVEGLRDGPAFASALRALRNAGKPCAVLKIGRSEAGRQMALTHTGALAGDAAVFDSVVRDAGGLVAQGIEDLCQIGGLATWLAKKLPQLARDEPFRIGLVCGSGGEAALLADRYSQAGLDLPGPSARFVTYVERNFAYAQAGNPFDLTGEIISTPRLVAETARQLIEEPVDLAHLAFPTFRDELALKLFNGLEPALANSRIPVLISTWSCRGLTEHSLRALRATAARVVERSETVPETLAAISLWIKSSDGEGVAVQESDPSVLAELEALPSEGELGLPQLGSLLEVLGLRLPGRFDWIDAGLSLTSGSYFVKGYQTGVLHKKAAGLVEGPLVGLRQVHDAAARIHAAHPLASIEVEDAVAGFEILLGLRRDPLFGWNLTVGLGGLIAEALGEPLLITPYSGLAAAQTRIRRSPVGQMLLKIEGGRGEQAMRQLYGVVSRLISAAFTIVGYLDLLELNPVMVDTVTGDCWAVDAVGLRPAERN